MRVTTPDISYTGDDDDEELKARDVLILILASLLALLGMHQIAPRGLECISCGHTWIIPRLDGQPR